MLVIRVEIWPGGNPRGRRTIGTAAIANVSELANVSDYTVALMDERGYVSDVREVHRHRRSAGFWPLLARAFQPSRGSRPVSQDTDELAERMAEIVRDQLES